MPMFSDIDMAYLRSLWVPPWLWMQSQVHAACHGISTRSGGSERATASRLIASRRQEHFLVTKAAKRWLSDDAQGVRLAHDYISNY